MCKPINNTKLINFDYNIFVVFRAERKRQEIEKEMTNKKAKKYI